MQKAIRFLAVCILLMAVLAIPALAQDAPVNTTPPQPLAGRASYTANCAPCHGATGQGDGASASGLGVPPAKLGDAALAGSKSLAEWFDITKNGNMQRMMPPWKDRLTDQEIWDTVAYAWTLHTSAEEVEQGKQVYDANCASCHGPDGKGSQAGVPDLTDFAATSGVTQATWAQVVAEGKGEMPGFADKLSAGEQAAALEYTRGLSFGGTLFRGPLEKGTGVISGTVTNQTTGAPLAGLAIELGIFDETALLGQTSAVSDAGGVYRFTELSTDPGLAYVVRTEYPTGVPYNTDFVSFEAGQTELDLPVAVYETTNEANGLRIERVHYIVEFESEQALVAELLLFSMDGDRTYLGDETGVLQFSLPAGAQGLEIDGDDGAGRFAQTTDGFVDRLALRPGQNVRQILFRYTLPYADGQLDFVHTLPYPATNVNALISDVGQQVTSAQLAGQGVRATENGNYYNLLGQDLPAGQQILIRMTNLPTSGAVTSGAGTTASSTSSALNRWLLAALIGLAAGGAVALILLPIVRARTNPQGVLAGSNATRDELVDALARLDLAYEAGELAETAYRDQRLRLKAQLSDLLRREGAA